MDYKDKLLSFNATKKYNRELGFLSGLLPNGLPILDYGCGTGYALGELRGCGFDVYGCDANDYYFGDRRFYKTKTIGFSCIYFMHSIAHIEDIAGVLKWCAKALVKGGSVVVITPNKAWLETMKGDYSPDPTVINHYSIESLGELFKEWDIEIIGQFGQVSNGLNERLFLKATF